VLKYYVPTPLSMLVNALCQPSSFDFAGLSQKVLAASSVNRNGFSCFWDYTIQWLKKAILNPYLKTVEPNLDIFTQASAIAVQHRSRGVVVICLPYGYNSG